MGAGTTDAKPIFSAIAGALMLKRTDWRALQWTEDDAGEPIQLEFAFLSMHPPPVSRQYDDGRRSGLKHRR